MRICPACEADRRNLSAGEALAIGLAIARLSHAGLCRAHSELRMGNVALARIRGEKKDPTNG